MTKKAQIGLIEVKCHNHEFSDLCRMAKTENTNVTAFTSEEMFDQISEELKGQTQNYDWVLKKKSESLRHFFKRVERVCKEKGIDLMIVNSLRDWRFIFFEPGCKTLSIISNLRWWFEDTHSVKNYFKKLFSWTNLKDRNPLSNAVTGAFLRKKILSNINGFIVEYPPFKEAIQHEFKDERQAFFFPNRPFGELGAENNNSSCFKIAVPGSICDLRRDYEFILDVFEKIYAENIADFEVFFLGQPIEEYGQKIRKRCAKLKEKGLKIYCPDGYVPAQFLEDTMKKCDVILSPLKFHYRSSTVTEVYTFTKGTGIFSDVVKYAKPCVVPSDYNVAREFSDSFLTYKTRDELKGVLKDLMLHADKLQALKSHAYKNSSMLSIDKIHESFHKMLQEMECA